MIGSSLSGITFSGLSSGIDSDAIISRLIALESIPIQRLLRQQQEIQSRQGVLQQLRSTLSTLGAAAGVLNSAGSFRPVSGTSSNPEVAAMVVGANAQPGTYSLEVSQLAQAHKVSSSAQADTTTALGRSGILVVNGKGVSIEAGDSLTMIAQKINGANAGVVASLINGGAGNAYLTLTSSSSGAKGKVHLADLTGSVASSLGLATGSDFIREAISNGATSVGFSSSTRPVAELLGAAGLSATSFTINGVQVDVNLQSQSLADIAIAINAASTGATASVRVEDRNGVTTYKLDIVGASTPVFSDPEGTLKALGILQSAYGSELVPAQDAEFKLDGVSLASATNTIANVIPDVTLTLLKANATTPEKSTLTLKQDNAAVKAKIKDFVSAYNGVIDFIKSRSSFNSETFASGPLFGDPTARQTEQALADTVFASVAGLAGPYTNLAHVGFGLDENGKLTLDEAILDRALSTSAAAVGELFRATGQATVSTIEFVSSTSKTKPSGAGLYDVVITQLATLSAYLAESAQTAPTATSETLTFSGALFGSENYVLLLPAGTSQPDIANLINTDSRLRNLVQASVEDGKLKIVSKRYGASGNFSVVSNLPAASDNSGIGDAEAGLKTQGVDVAGTIGGEAATGNGRYLTGNAGNANTDGLQILYSGSLTGLVGGVRFTKGIGTLANELVSSFTDAINGLFTANDQALQTQIDTIGQTIKGLQESLALKEQTLRRRFAAMEQAISQMQIQQQRLAAFLQSNQR